MKPDEFQMALLLSRSDFARHKEQARRAALHRAAKARRAKAKRGGKR